MDWFWIRARERARRLEEVRQLRAVKQFHRRKKWIAALLEKLQVEIDNEPEGRNRRRLMIQKFALEMSAAM